MLYVTGDLHADFDELLARVQGLTARDCLLVCGDFGFLWNNSMREKLRLDLMNAMLPCTLLFVDGNHENFDLLAALPAEEWHGGKAHRVRSKIYHLMRGQVFTLYGRTLFTMGGASSHDIDDGVLEPDDPSLRGKCRALTEAGGLYRVNHVSWWKAELPDGAEQAEGLRNLARSGWRVDYVASHCLPSSVQDQFSSGLYTHDSLTDYFDVVRGCCRFNAWFCGHYHRDACYLEQFHVCYRRVLRADSAQWQDAAAL